MPASQRPLPWRPDRTFVASNAEVDPLWFVEVAWAALTMRQRFVLVAGALGWESYTASDPGGSPSAPLPLGALVPPEDVRLLKRLLAERPELAVRWLAAIDQEERTHRARPVGGHGAGRRRPGCRRVWWMRMSQSRSSWPDTAYPTWPAARPGRTELRYPRACERG